MLKFSPTERHVLTNLGGYSRQLVHHWEQSGYVPTKHLRRVSKLIGRPLDDLLPSSKDGDIAIPQ